jgi:phage baseplate assembly protein W
MKSINIKFPLEDDKDKNNLFMLNYVTKNALISDLKLLLLTKRGQRYYMPDFGTNLEKYIFQPEDTTTEEEIIADLRKAVRDFMPEIQITKVQFFTNGDESYEELSDNELRILINFTYSDDVFSDAGQIELTF